MSLDVRLSRPEHPGPGQESVWDYPRPPAVESCRQRVRVVLGGVVVVDTTAALRVLETSHPPTYYLPMCHVAPGSLRPAAGVSTCEWKGEASYFDLVGGDRVAHAAAWTYASPRVRYSALRGHVAVMPGAVDACYVGDERVRPQPGGFYGGWITDSVTGPFKGHPGTAGW